MQLVIDSNKLQSDELRAFLSRSRSNRAVLTDYAAMEAHKGDTLASIFKSMQVVADFPRQVIILKGTSAVGAMRGRASGLQRRLVDEVQTRDFPQYIDHLRSAQRGNLGLQTQLLEHGRVASEHLGRMLKDAETTGAVFAELAQRYTKEERQAVRLDERYPSGFLDKAAETLALLVNGAFEKHPGVTWKPTFEELPNTFILRYTLCIYLLVLDWAARGDALGAKPWKLQNDFVDANFAAYGTYFDGLMTGDVKLRRLHGQARAWLMGLYACELPSGLGYGNHT